MKHTKIVAKPGSGKSTYISGVITGNLFGTYMEPKKMLVIDRGGSYRKLAEKLNQYHVEYIDIEKSEHIGWKLNEISNVIIFDFPYCNESQISAAEESFKEIESTILNILNTHQDMLVIIDEVFSFNQSWITSLSRNKHDYLYVAQSDSDIPSSIYCDIRIEMTAGYPDPYKKTA